MCPLPHSFLSPRNVWFTDAAITQLLLDVAFLLFVSLSEQPAVDGLSFELILEDS